MIVVDDTTTVLRDLELRFSLVSLRLWCWCWWRWSWWLNDRLCLEIFLWWLTINLGQVIFKTLGTWDPLADLINLSPKAERNVSANCLKYNLSPISVIWDFIKLSFGCHFKIIAGFCHCIQPKRKNDLVIYYIALLFKMHTSGILYFSLSFPLPFHLTLSLDDRSGNKCSKALFALWRVWSGTKC